MYGHKARVPIAASTTNRSAPPRPRSGCRNATRSFLLLRSSSIQNYKINLQLALGCEDVNI